MEIEITSFFATVTPRELSSSIAESGPHAGALTWAASLKATIPHNLLDTAEKREAFRAWVEQSGFEWEGVDLDALFLQWIAGDLREMGCEWDTSGIDWDEVERGQQEGTVPSNIYRGDDGSVYFSLT